MKEGVIILLLTLFCFNLTAQDTRQNELHFVYISHSLDTQTEKVCDDIKKIRDNAMNHRLPTIIYFANLKSPVVTIIAVDGEGMDDTEYGKENYNTMLSEMREKSFHNIDPSTDIETITQLFDKHDFLDQNGNPKYASMKWTLYVSQAFWDLNYNEKVIANLYFILDIARLPKDFFHMSVYNTSTKDLKYDKEKPFGF